MRPSGWDCGLIKWCPFKKRYGSGTCIGKRPCEDPSRKRLYTNQGVRPQENSNPPTPYSSASRLQNGEELSFSYLSQPICGVLLWQPEQTNTASFLTILKVLKYFWITLSWQSDEGLVKGRKYTLFSSVYLFFIVCMYFYFSSVYLLFSSVCIQSTLGTHGDWLQTLRRQRNPWMLKSLIWNGVFA